MKKIAETVLPDKVIFSSLDQLPNKFVKDNIAILNKKLNPLGISVEWYQLDSHIFEPFPI